MSETIRLQKLLANWGVASRRAVEKMISNGRVSVDGKIVTTQGLKIDPETFPKISVDGKIIKPRTKTSSSIYAFHKPVGVLTTLSDPQGRPTIKKYLPSGKRLYPIGRLDNNSSGLLLITDNGELTNRLLHPSFKVEKEYVVKITGSSLTKRERAEFRDGVEIEGKKTLPCKLNQHRNSMTYTVIIKEGRKRQIRLMFREFKKNVEMLHRVRMGPISLGNLKPGEIRPLTEKERNALLKEVKLLK